MQLRSLLVTLANQAWLLFLTIDLIFSLVLLKLIKNEENCYHNLFTN